VNAALSEHCLDLSEPKTLIGWMSHRRLYTARWSFPHLEPSRSPIDAAPRPNQHRPAGPDSPGAYQPPDPASKEWEVPRLPLRYDRAVLAGAIVQDKLRTLRAAQGRPYDGAAHQAAASEQLLTHQDAETAAVADRQDSEPRSAIDMTALRALKKSRTDTESLELTDERLRHLQDDSARRAMGPMSG
jgi:hypothetical protein